MAEWPIAAIGDVAAIFDGPHATPRTVRDGPIFLGISSLEAGRINLSETRHVTPEDFKKWTRRVQPMKDDVVFSYETRLGEAAIIPEGLECCLGRRMGLVRTDRSRLDPRFFLYYYLSPRFQDFLRSRTIHGATVDRIPLKDFPSFPVPVPPLDEQKTISEFLGSLDDKIELNRRMNETLEAMAQAIFRDWFVDFGPTRRKIESATDPVEVMGRLVADPDRAQELADLFPARLGDDGLPEGWRNGLLGDVAQPVGTSVLPSQIAPDTPYIGLEHMPRRSIALAEWEVASKVSSNKSAFCRGQILFGKLRPYFHKVGIAPVDGVCSTDVIVLDAITEHVRSLIVACVSTDEFVAFTDQGSTGTKMPRTSWGNMKKYQIALATDAVVASFATIASPLMDKIVASIHENRTLAATRDLLLPRLMSGEIRLHDAEAKLEAAR